MSMREQVSVEPRLAVLNRQLRRRALLGIIGYSVGLAGALALCFAVPFELSRVGSVVMGIGFAHMLGKICRAGMRIGENQESELVPSGFARQPAGERKEMCCRIDAQLDLISSTTYNLPLLVGANVFLIGLPGTGSAEGKAWFD